MAGKGAGLYQDIKDTARALVQIEKTFLPNPENRELYEKAFRNWKAAYAPLLRLSDEGITRHMWSAPGLE
jgi:autoinducer 2 (AI-2) kinase